MQAIRFTPRTAIAFAIIAGASTLRTIGLSDRTVWFDEAFTWKLITGFSWAEMFSAIAQDFHPPLHHILSRAFVGQFGDSPASLRFLSVLFGVLCVALMCFAGRLLFSSADDACDRENRDATPRAGERDALPHQDVVGLLAAAMLTLSAFHIRWSQECRMYSLLSLLSLISTMCLWRLLQARKHSRVAGALYITSAASLLYTHYFGVFLFATQAAILLWSRFWNCNGRSRDTRGARNPVAVGALSKSREAAQPVVARRGFRDLGATVGLRCVGILPTIAFIIAPVIIFLPWVPVFASQAQEVRKDFWISPVSASAVVDAITELAVSERFASAVPLGVRCVIAAAVLAIVVDATLRGGAVDRYLVFLVVLPIVASIVVSVLLTPVFYPRYLIGSATLFPLVLSSWLLRNLRPLALSAAVLLLLSTMAGTTVYSRLQESGREGARGAILHVLTESSAAPLVVAAQPNRLFELQYYARNVGRMSVRTLADLDKTPKYAGRPALREGDLISEVEIDGWQGDVWLVESDAWSRGFPPSPFPRGDTEEPVMFRSLHNGWGHLRLRRL